MPPKKIETYTEPLVIKFASERFMPEPKQVMGKPWVYMGEKNDWFDFLMALYYNSSKHNAIINGKTKYIAGGGWGEKGSVKMNGDGDTLNNLTWKTTLDEEIYGGEAYEVIWTAGGTAEFKHVDCSKVRTNKDETEYYYTSEWLTKYGNPVFDPRKNKDFTVYAPFDPNNTGEKQLLYYKCYSPGIDVYPIPEYKASILYIDLEYQIANYWSNRVRNGFMPSAIINFYGPKPSADEIDKVEKMIKAKFGGTDNAGQFVINFASNKEFSADVSQFSPPELGQEYEALNKTLQTEIFTGHGVTNGMLFGIKEAGQLGGRSELIEANELFQNRYVTPKQLKKEEFYKQFIFPYVKDLKGAGELKLQKQEPIGYMFSESTMVKYLPQRAMSEMVAAKMGIDLTKYPELKAEQDAAKEQEKQSRQAFSKKKAESSLLEFLRKKAKKRKVKEVIHERPVTYEMSRNLKASEEEVRMSFAKQPNPIIIGGTGPVGSMPPPSAKPTEVISIVYTYEWIDGFSDADIDSSREFCIEMRGMTNDGMTWKREDIDSLDNEARADVSDVWASRGGWWNDGGVAVPHCRHQWKQKVIRELVS